MSKSLEQLEARLAKLGEKRRALQARKRRILARERSKARKLRTRGLILLATDLVARARTDQQLRGFLVSALRAHAERVPRNREACEMVAQELLSGGEKLGEVEKIL